MRFRFLIAIVVMPLSLLAQLTAPGSNAVRLTSYFSAPGIKDQIFFYCNTTGTERGTLTATRQGGSGIYDFNWFQWNDLTNSYSILIKTDSGVSSSTLIDLVEGGYKVFIDSAGIFIKSLAGWIFFDRPPVAKAVLANPLKNCNYVALDGDTSATIAVFFYKDPSTGTLKGLPNEITFVWSSDPSSSIPRPDLEIDPITYSPPLEDVTYKLKVNSLGCSSESSFFYESIHVKADFTVDPTDGEAPLEVSFTNKSIRGSQFLWEFGDSTKSELSDPIPHIYYKPGEYSVKLTIESNLHCTSSLIFEPIKVEPSSLSIPNVFTPDGDGYNDWFMVDSKSQRYISMEVFSQSGLKIYGYSAEGEQLKNWQGWDGNINNTSIKASPGVYFYIIRAIGWDNIKYDSKEYRGVVYLYR